LKRQIFFPFEEKSASNNVSQQTKPVTKDLFSSQSPQKPEGLFGKYSFYYWSEV